MWTASLLLTSVTCVSRQLHFKAAYDHVDREALWHHLRNIIGVPPQLLNVIQNMYSGDAYRLVDGLTSTAPISPSKGVAHLAQSCLRCFSAM
jgi:hypothetical protein